MLLTVVEYDPKPWEEHRQTVAAICKQKALSDDPSNLAALNRVVQIDLDTSTAWAEPNVTMDELVQMTLAHRLIPAVVAASKTTTVVDAFATPTCESSSFRFGTFDCAVLSLEAVRRNGQYVMAKLHDCKTADLLFESAEALHRLAFTTLLEIALIPASEYVEISYWPVSSISGAILRMQPKELNSLILDRSAVDSSTDFIESIMFDCSTGVVISGRFTLTMDHPSNPQLPKSDSFVQHAQSIYEASPYTRSVETIPLMEYLFRHDDFRAAQLGRERHFGDRRDSLITQDAARVAPDIALPSKAVQEHVHSSLWHQYNRPINISPVEPHSTFGRRSFSTGAAFENVLWNIRVLRRLPRANIYTSNMSKQMRKSHVRDAVLSGFDSLLSHYRRASKVVRLDYGTGTGNLATEVPLPSHLHQTFTHHNYGYTTSIWTRVVPKCA
jgi:hypothetical protein